jgi:VIT1/CCC1 family predicted Fe2+/Mn2+ transporter
MDAPDSQRRFRANLQGEIDGAAVYRALAKSESDPKLAEVFGRLAAVEEAHADFWRARLEDNPRLTPSMRARMMIWMARRFGPAFVVPTLAAAEARDSTAYDDQQDAALAGLPADERSHARIMQAVAGVGGLSGPTLAMLEGRSRGGGNSLRAAVLGANDGLVSNVSLVMGVAGATQNEGTLLLTGLAGLVAGACSMAMGEWLSVTSARELSQKQIAVEAEELRVAPEEEKEELILIYQAKGLEEEQARVLADRLLSNRETALDTLAREELGIDPEELGGSAWQAGLWSFLLFSAGAIVPVAPFIFLSGKAAFITSLGASGLALMAIGLGTSLFTGRSALYSALRQLAIGAAAAGITYAAGTAVGVSLG